MTANRNGQVVTFYSYKGGTGRTMALANVAWILAANGKRVLVLDWDLESPGLDRFFAPFMDPGTLTSTGGVIELIREYEWAAARKTQRDDAWFEELARVHKYSFSLSWDFPPGATLDFISAGRQNSDYADAISGINWDDFYERQGGGLFFDALRADMKRHYDYTLIDSRTGLSDVADICTTHLPDTLVDCFTLSEQGINGAKLTADRVRSRGNSQDRKIRILPVPMRVDPAEKRKADAGRLVARQRFDGLPANLSEAEREIYWSAMQIPYQAYYGYEESLATFGDSPGSHGSLLSHYEILTRYLTDGQISSLPPIDDGLRRRVNERFVRQPEQVETEVVLEYAPVDQVWAEWIENVLVSADVRVLDPWTRPADADHKTMQSARVLKIVSRADTTAEDPRGERTLTRDPLVVYVADVAPLSRPASYARIGGLDAGPAAQELLRLVGRPPNEARSTPSRTGARFPGTDPVIFNVPSPNVRFTGRDDDLRRLRLQLRDAPRGVEASTAALQGMGGLGKTQVALEYAHRFRGAYDVVHWVNAEPFTFVDSQLIDLAGQLGVAEQATGPDTMRAVLSALARGEPHARWLLIYDNAEDPRVEGLLPRGPGHVLITSRDPSWSERALSNQLDVFDRAESIALIHKRNPTLPHEEADKVAEALGDLPIAVAAAGAWLADTGARVEEYLDELESLGPDVLQLEGATDKSVAATWSLSLQRLSERSPAAARLLQLCSVLASDIALDLIHSDALARALTSYDPSVSERIFRGALVQHMNRLALIRVDQRGESTQVGEHGERGHGGQIIVHRLLQLMVRSQLSQHTLNNTRHEVHEVLANLRPDGEVDDPEQWAKFRMLWPHVEVSDAVNCPQENVRRLMIDRVRYLWLRGDLERARVRAERTDVSWTELLERTHNPSDRHALQMQLHHLRFNHANVLRFQGRFDEARSLSERTLEAQTALLGAGHPHTLLTAGGLAGDLRGLGRYADALDLDRQTHAAWLEVWGDDHPRTLAALNNLATSHRLMGHFQAARALDEQVYQRRRSVLGDNHPMTLSSLENLSRDVRDVGEYDRSIELINVLVKASAEVAGPRSREALNARVNLAASLRSAGRAAEAADLLEETVPQLRDAQGLTSPDARAGRLSWAVNLMATRQFAAARHELREVYNLYRSALGDDHPHTLSCSVNLAMSLRALGELAQAIELTDEAATALTRQLGSEHPFTLDTQTNLAVCLADSGKKSEAQQLLTETLPQVATVFGAEHPVTLRCRLNLSLVRQQMEGGQPDAEHARTMDLLTRQLGPQHRIIVDLRDGYLVSRTIDPHPF